MFMKVEVIDRLDYLFKLKIFSLVCILSQISLNNQMKITLEDNPIIPFYRVKYFSLAYSP